MTKTKTQPEFRAHALTDVKVENREDGTPFVFGYAAVWYDGTPRTEYRLADGYVERINKRAFNSILKSRADVVALFNHDSNQVLGRRSAKTMKMGKDDTGLWYEIDMPTTTVGQDVLTSVRRKDVRGGSFSFSLGPDGQRISQEKDEEGNITTVRELRDFSRVYDVGPVTFPAYSATEDEGISVRSEDAGAAVEARDKWLASCGGTEIPPEAAEVLADEEKVLQFHERQLRQHELQKRRANVAARLKEIEAG